MEFTQQKMDGLLLDVSLTKRLSESHYLSENSNTPSPSSYLYEDPVSRCKQVLPRRVAESKPTTTRPQVKQTSQLLVHTMLVT